MKLLTNNKLETIKNQEYKKGYNAATEDSKCAIKNAINNQRKNDDEKYKVLEDKYHDLLASSDYENSKNACLISNLEKQLDDLNKKNKNEIDSLNAQICNHEINKKELKKEYKSQIKNLKTSISLYKTNKEKRDKFLLDLIKNLKEYSIKVEREKDGSFNITKIIKEKNPGHLYDGPKREVDKYFVDGKKVKVEPEKDDAIINKANPDKPSVIQRINNLHQTSDNKLKDRNNNSSESIASKLSSLKCNKEPLKFLPAEDNEPEIIENSTVELITDEINSVALPKTHKKDRSRRKGFKKNK